MIPSLALRGVRDQWGRAPSYRLDDEGLHGQKLVYDFKEGGHYLGLEVVDKCPSDLEKAIRLRQRILSKIVPPYLRGNPGNSG